MDPVLSTPTVVQGTCLIGTVKSFAGTFAPRGWTVADGKLLRILDFQSLFSILGTLYGGDGTTSFALPKIETNQSVASSPAMMICARGLYPARS